MGRIEEIKQRLERNKKWQTLIESGYVPSAVGEYRHDDVEWLIEQAERAERYENVEVAERVKKNLNLLADDWSKVVDERNELVKKVERYEKALNEMVDDKKNWYGNPWWIEIAKEALEGLGK
jgi:hypothetical protein